jgi:hypothetical protein
VTRTMAQNDRITVELDRAKWEELKRICQEHYDVIMAKGYDEADEDDDHYIYEAAMEVCLGADVFSRMNARYDELREERKDCD